MNFFLLNFLQNRLSGFVNSDEVDDTESFKTKNAYTIKEEKKKTKITHQIQ